MARGVKGKKVKNKLLFTQGETAFTIYILQSFHRIYDKIGKITGILMTLRSFIFLITGAKASCCRNESFTSRGIIHRALSTVAKLQGQV